MTIKNRLTLRFTLIVGAMLLVFSLIIYFLSANFLEQNFLKKLKEKVNLTSAFLIKNGAVDTKIISAVNKNMMNSILGEKILIIDKTGNIHYHSFAGNKHPFSKSFIDDVSQNKNALLVGDDKIWYGISIILENKELILVAESKRDYIPILTQLKLFLLFGLFILLLVVFFAGRYFAGQALEPISKVINEVDNISEKNLHNKVNEGNGKDEIAQLAKTFNRLLTRLEIAFDLQRNFVSNASHEIRTPLSSITAQLEVTLMSTRPIEEYKLVLNSILEDIRHLNKLSEGLFDLTLASRDVSLMKFENIRIDELLLQSRSDLLKRKNDYKINFYPGELPDEEKLLTTFGNEYLLKSAFNNLMDNACKFSTDKTVNVFMEIINQKINVRFSDKGIGMPASYLDQLYTPLLRGENAKKIPGHGLGMALTKKIVDLHRSEIKVFSEENKGTDIVFTIPAI